MKTIEIKGTQYGFCFNMNVLDKFAELTGVDFLTIEYPEGEDTGRFLLKTLKTSGVKKLACLSVLEWCRREDKQTRPSEEEIGGEFVFSQHFVPMIEELMKDLVPDHQAAGNGAGSLKAPRKISATQPK